MHSSELISIVKGARRQPAALTGLFEAHAAEAHATHALEPLRLIALRGITGDWIEFALHAVMTRVSGPPLHTYHRPHKNEQRIEGRRIGFARATGDRSPIDRGR